MMNSWICLLLVAVSGLAFVLSSENGQPNNCEEFYQSNGPRISPCKKEIILQQGQNFTLLCQAKTEIKYFKQQEVPEENIGKFSIVQRNESNENAEYQYEVYLDLNNVDRYAIGFYACVDNTVSDQTDVLNTLVDEPSNTEHVSFIYIYVNGTDSLFAPMMEVVSGKSGSYVVECRPSTPEVDVKLFMADIPENTYKRYSPKLGFVYDSDSLEVLTDLASLTTLLTCAFKNQHRTVAKDLLFVKQQKAILQPTVSGGNKNFLPEETFSINCTVDYTHNSAHNLTWKLPDESIRGTILEESNNNNVTGGILYRSIKITNATKKHAGTYTCYSKNICGVKEASYEKKYVENPYLRIYDFLKKPGNIVESAQPSFTFAVEIKSYPPANFTFYRNNTEIKTDRNKTWNPRSKEATYTIVKKSVEDSDKYTIFATNGILNDSFTYDVRFQSAPEVTFNSNDKTCLLNTMTSLECEVTGYPLPRVTWIFSNNETERLLEVKTVNATSMYREKVVLDILCESTGYITCNATNIIGNISETKKLIAYEVLDGFGIMYNGESIDSPLWFSERQNISIKCAASIHDFTNVTWVMDENDDLKELVKYSQNTLSFIAELNINFITLNHTGTYTCRGTKVDGTDKHYSIIVNVAALQSPVVTFTSNIQKDGNVQRHQSIEMFCQAQGVPRPTIQWRKDDQDFNPVNGVTTKIVNRTTVYSRYFIDHLNDYQIGTYHCKAVSNEGNDMQGVTLVLEEVSSISMKYIVIVVIICVVFLILVVYLSCKIKKEKQFRKELAAAGLLYFKEGVTKSLNPDLGIDEQAELLPYNEKFEFPSEKLVYGKQLGAGAFGVVYKAEARGIINAEETTTVAVKMVKKTADNMYIKALASELKIMVHMGKHINIVNLLGACTKNVGKRELVVIVEYCKFGNIHNYMQRHRDVFIDQFSDNNKEKNFGKVNRGYDSSGSTGAQSDYGTANTQDTNNTFLTNNTNQTSRKNVASQPTEVVKVSEGYVQADWRANYESDYSYDGRSPRPLTSRDLLAWAFQIARGMEYLASRKVLHGDLAARNILLADDNIVKICDFGLARSIYKNDEYQKKENSLLPVKWLAIECMTDRIFSTQSDVWSFGIVLWELFTLAKTPYPNISPANLIQFLTEGHRLDKPTYSDDRIYNLMKRCWEQKPTVRPSFTQLQEILGTFLEDNVRNHYVDLNTEYMDLNSKPENQEDYLDMVCAPDYNNMVTPSPHHYVNEVNNPRSFFPPTPTRVDEEGYLQMSPAANNDIFSPKATGTKFDFDPRKYNPRPSEASNGGSELTPMLTLNNLPRSGSDSDHEGNASPYLNACPRIEEETDEVFEIKLNNVKNALNSAVSNPTYITFGDSDLDKKPIDTKNYANIVPNGLVK